jgi:hypothetical protein
MLSRDNVVVGQYYRLHIPYASAHNNAILRIQSNSQCTLISNSQCTLIWHPNPGLFNNPGDTWNLLEDDLFEELTDEEITLYLLAS